MEPNCEVCVDQYGFTELLPENIPLVKLFSMLNSQFVVDLNLGGYIFDRHDEDVVLMGGIDKVLHRLDIVYKTFKDLTKDNNPPPSTAPVLARNHPSFQSPRVRR